MPCVFLAANSGMESAIFPDCTRAMPTLTLTIIYSYYRHLITQISIVIISVRLADSFVFCFNWFLVCVIYSVHFHFNLIRIQKKKRIVWQVDPE